MSLWDKAVESLKLKDKQNVDFQRLDKRAILADILKETQKKKQACIERRLKYKRKNGEFVVLYNVKWVNKFKEVGDIAVQYDPGHAALPWAAIRFFLQISVNDVQIFGSLAEGLEVVCKIVARYAAVERLYLRQSSSVENLLENSIIAVYVSILRFFSKCRKHFDLGFTQRLARRMTQIPDSLIKSHLDKIAISDGHVVELTKIVDAERLQLTLAQQSSMTTAINSLGSGVGALQVGSRESASKLEALLASFQGPLIRTVEQISNLSDNLVHSKTNQMKEERLEILQWLSSVQYRKHHQSLSKGLLEGTGSWLLAKPQFVDWSNSSVSSVLWLHGIPGSGKTCLMSTIIRQLLFKSSTSENAAPIDYFYCQRNTAELQRSDPTEVLRAILKQLLCYNPQWQEESSTAREYRERKIEADADGVEISRLDISETTEQIIEIASEMPVTIIIDALDECCSGQRHELLGALDVLLERSAHLVKVFVSSRDDVDIVLRLQKHPNIYININDNKDDIRRFIQFEIQKAHSNRRLLKGMASPELITLVTKGLTNRAGGMFLWVSMQIESLCDSRRVKLQGDLVDALARLPRSLAGMYTLILENIGQIDQRGRTVAETIFRWLLCTKDARSSVTIAACSRAISIESRNLSIPDILDVCSTLVVYDESLDRFRFAHLSAREFFESQPGYTPSEANRSILETSLQIVICHQPYEGRFWLYATAYWIFHYHKLEEQHRKEVFEFHAKCFFFSGAECSDVFKKWAIGAIEAHALNGDWLDPELLYSPFQEFGIRTHHLDTFDEVFRSPVDLASCSGWLEILDHFKTNQSPDDFYGPATKIMRMAIHFGQTSVVRWLFDQNVCPTDEHFEIAFHLGRPEIVQTFLDMNVLSLNTLVKGHEILVLAVCSGPRDIPWDLIKKRASTRYQDQNGRTLLFHAVSTSSNNSESIEDLLLTGIDPTAKDEAGKTPLSLSIWGGRQLRSYLLLKKRHLFKSSTFEHAKNIQQHVLQLSDDHTACLLLHYGLDTMLDDADICAEWMEILTLIGTLPGLQSDVSTSVIKRTGKLADDSENEIQVAGQTLLSLAAFFRHDKAFRVLLGWGIDPTCPAICNVRKTTSTVAQTGRSMKRQEPVDQKRESQKNKMSDELRQGPLAWATYTGNLPVVQSILDRGLNPNIKNRKGQTALYCAVQKTEDKYLRKDLETDKEAIVRLLLQKGAFVTSADTYGGATLLAHGFKARYSNIAKLLLENGAGIPKGATDGPMELLWGAFDQGQEGLRQNLLERIRGAQDDSLDLQPSSSVFGWSGEPIGIAARLIWAGTMRVLGDMVLTASGDVNSSTRWGSV